MLLKEIMEIRNNQWKKYRRCKKNCKQANKAYSKAKHEIHQISHIYRTATEADIERPYGSPCMKTTIEDLNGPATIDNLPLTELIHDYDRNCEQFPDCKDTSCMNYKNYSNFKRAEKNKSNAQDELNKAKTEFENAKTAFWQRVKNKIIKR